MYPRVRVRNHDRDDDEIFVEDDGGGSRLLLKVFETLSVGHSLSHADKNKVRSSPLVAKLPKDYTPNVATPSVSISKGIKKISKNLGNDNDGDTMPNIRASSVPRPRAVVSSPDNDGMIGNKNKLLRERPSPLKRNTLEQNTPPKLKIIPNCVKQESLLNARKDDSKKDSENRSRLKERKSLQPISQKPRATPGKAKSNSVEI